MSETAVKEVWVFCQTEDGIPDDADLGLIGKACGLAADLNGKACAVVCAKGEMDAGALIGSGADTVYQIRADGSEEVKARLLFDLAKKLTPEIILFSATVAGCSVAARAAAMLQTGLTADCTDLSVAEKSLLRQIRPAFGGGITAEIFCAMKRPQMATVRTNRYPAPKPDPSRKGTVIVHVPEKIPYDPIELIERQLIPAKRHLREGRIIVAGGKGIGSREGFSLLEKLALRLGGMVGASRSAVDAGFASYERQIGQTGVSVSPRLYLAFGISGAVQHIAGMHTSGTVIAVNRDPKAPIFDYADLAIEGDWRETAEKLVGAMENSR